MSNSAVQTGVTFSDCTIQTDVNETISSLQKEVIQLQVKNQEQQEEIKQLKLSEEAFKNNDQKVQVLHWCSVIRSMLKESDISWS